MKYCNQTLSERVVRDLKKRSMGGIITYPAALLIVLFGDGYFYRHVWFSSQFIVLVFGICGFRLAHRLLDPHIPERFSGLSTRLFLVELCLTGLIWGIGYARAMMQTGEPNFQLLMLVCTMGLCAGGVTANSPYLWLSLGYNAMTLWPGILTVGILGLNWPLVILICIYSVYMANLSLRANAEYRTALDNEALLKKKTRDLEKLSHVDGLTGLYNRRYFDTALEVAWQGSVRQKTSLALVLCDIDYFKKINDDHGHLAGDEYLKILARHLRRVFRRQSDIVARYGGEEFVVLIAEGRPGTVADLAETFRKTMEETTLSLESKTIRATVSVGVAELVPGPGEDKESLIARADAMLYDAKARGRNQVRVDKG